MPRRTGSALLGLLLAAPAAGRAAGVRLSAELSPAEVSLGETAELVVRLESDQAPAEVQLPRDGDGFRVIPGEHSTRTEVALQGGGLVLRQVRLWTLAIEPRRRGTLAIPGPVAVVGGERHTHRDLELRVSDAPRRPRAGPDGEPPDRPGSMSWRGWERDLSLRLRLDRKEAFVGEQVTATLELVSPVELVDWDSYRPPGLDGFWAEDLGARPSRRIERVDGTPVRIYSLKKLALFPNRPGPLTVGPAELDFRVQIASRDPLGLFPEVRRARRASRPVALTVKPLPPGAPPGFEPGNVGEWRLERAAPGGARPAGQPFALRLVARGAGNLRALSLPGVPAVPGLRAFDPAASDEVKLQGDRFGGSRTVETPLALERPGAIRLPEVEWPYFDPRTGRYRTALLPELRLEAGPPAAAPSAAAADAAALSAELRPLRSEAGLGPRRPPAWRTPWFLGAAGAPPLLFAAAALAARLRQGYALGAGDRRRRGAAAQARRRLASARRRLSAGDAPGALEAVARALEGYAADRLGRPVAGLTREALAVALGEAGARGAAAGLLARALQACDAGRFGGAAAEDLLARAEEAVARLEEAEWRPGGGA
jgi:hypothetical protein